ncbi:RNA polymerase sigma-70 factor, ECF subfamily [Chryseolinea serpens]|uniref:RNA polymerase sigma-70 factor, ECF subfamily n=1 Tax=Chryseolinea serpens TaxID=947013 RepID=A0A1M5L832_9BACT|nr:RNA polymerase sigma factor [Chryseolinea serpens]SHG61171.1 RNA polymerase sigma-70 factor, ECF subfamily [Chryseolinea serpens]
MLSEQELIEGCRKGNRAFQKALYDRYCRKMLVVCLRYSKTTAEAEDILQEGFVKVFQGIKDFRQEAKLETWITRIMVNTALNVQRKKLYLYPMVDVAEINLPEEEMSISGIHFTQLLEMIQALPQGCQIVFNLFAIEGYSHKEIAESLGISEGTSKSQFARAKSLLQAKLLKESTYYERYGEAKI